MAGMATTTRRRGDTRAEIQRTALSRFTEQGYDKTSLREIAEDLGVTKAAVYYHFRSKEEIIESLVSEMAQSLDDLIAWAGDGPATRERRIEMLRRLGTATEGGLGDLMRCVQQNEASLSAMPATLNIVHRYKHQLWNAATPPQASVEDQLRVRLAITAVLLANNSAAELSGTPRERQEAALRVATELMP